MARHVKADRFVGTALAIISVFLYIVTPSQVGGGGELGALSGLFPRIALVITLVLSVGLILFPARKSGHVDAENADDNGGPLPIGRLACGYLIILAYVCLIGILGYYASTFLFLVTFAWYLGERNWLSTIVMSVAVTIGINLLSRALYLSLPTGALKLF
jgi:hypothetical protein